MRAIGYIRVSTEEQAKDGVSLDNQKRKIEAYCDLKDFNLIDTFVDDGISAKNLNRPGMKRVMEMAKKKEVDAIIVFKLDRMFRNTIDALQTTEQLDKWGISFHSINETLDTKSAMGKFFFTLMAGIAELERNTISERTKAAMDYKRQKQERISRHAPFGYSFDDDGNLIENEPEKRMLALIQKLRVRGLSYQKIADELKHRGITTRRGTDYSWSGVYQLIKKAA